MASVTIDPDRTTVTNANSGQLLKWSHFLLGPLCYTANSRSVLHMIGYICQCYFLHSSPLSSPHCVHKSILHICISTAALQTGSSLPSSRSHICALTFNIWFFSFWLTSLCITGSSFITSLPLTQIHSFLWLSNISLYIRNTSSLSIHLSMDI